MVSTHRQAARSKARVRAIVAVLLIACWSAAALSGLLLYLAPHGPRSGQAMLFLLRKEQWGDVHFWVSMLASMVTVVHLVIDWRAVRGCLRYLTRVDRAPVICE